MTERPLRVGVLGAGAISQIVHVPILAERRDVELAALGDTDHHKARTVADRFGVPSVGGPGEVLARDDLDAVVVATPNRFHEEMAVRAMEAGMHVLVERPVAPTPDGVERVLEAARRAERILVAGMPHRFRAEVAALRHFAAGGEFGAVYALRGSWLTRPSPVARPSWRQQEEEAGGGALMDLGVPTLDLCLWLVDFPPMSRVSCSLAYGDHEVEDAATLMAEGENGLALTLEVSNRYYGPEDRYYARVMGREGSGSVPPLEVYRQLGGRPLEVTPRQPRPRGGENIYTNAYRRLLDHFLRAVRGEAEAPLPTEQVALMRLIAAAYRSAREGREVAL